MDSILESFRILHEEREKLLDEMVQEYMKCSEKLVEMYEDKDDLKKEEVSVISGANEFAEFYGRIRNAKEFHRKNPNFVDTLVSEFEELKKLREKSYEDDLPVDFTDEELYGRFLDLHSLYQQFMNIDSIKNNETFNRLTYLEYLNIVDRMYDLSFEIKNNQEYESYILNLKEYLYSFIQRSKPLLDIEGEISDGLQQFDGQWSCGDFPGWDNPLLNTILQHCSNKLQVYQFVDFEIYHSAQDIESLGPVHLKNILKALRLKCG
ncbi:hypothetical protein MXB_5380, partial [Myxobolus squamalis]